MRVPFRCHVGWPIMVGSKIGTYEDNARHQLPDSILVDKWLPDTWQSSSMVTLSLVTTWGRTDAYQAQFWVIPDGSDIGEVQFL